MSPRSTLLASNQTLALASRMAVERARAHTMMLAGPTTLDTTLAIVLLGLWPVGCIVLTSRSVREIVRYALHQRHAQVDLLEAAVDIEAADPPARQPGTPRSVGGMPPPAYFADVDLDGVQIEAELQVETHHEDLRLYQWAWGRCVLGVLASLASVGLPHLFTLQLSALDPLAGCLVAGLSPAGAFVCLTLLFLAVGAHLASELCPRPTHVAYHVAPPQAVANDGQAAAPESPAPPAQPPTPQVVRPSMDLLDLIEDPDPAQDEDSDPWHPRKLGGNTLLRGYGPPQN